MDEVILRFPHLGVQIFQELDVGRLLNYKQVSRSWKNFIETEKPLNDKFVIMWLVYGYWKALPKCLDWVKNNFDFIMYRGSPTYTKITNMVSTNTFFGLCTCKWGN